MKNCYISSMRTFLLLGWLTLVTFYSHGQPEAAFVPAGGNAWVSGGLDKRNEQGWIELADPRSICTLYTRVDKGDVALSLEMRAEDPAKVSVEIRGIKKEIDLKANQQTHAIGTWSINQSGYIAVTVQGVSKSGPSFGILKGLTISGSAVSSESAFVPNNEGNYFYWGRRGPSVHLRFDAESDSNIEYFYSTITVPANNDVIGSYFMANGFSDGYFGFQVNSASERRILFSVWSPYKTDDPNSIPEADRVLLVGKGKDVYTGEFGNEGSGGQSFLKYRWKAGVTYGFLLRAQPVDNTATVYTAWFFAPDEGVWRLIASWRRPGKATYLQNLYSFLENFTPETGNQPRMAEYGNQWVRNASGNWIELTTATFTGDNTAKKNYRKDYAGGSNGSAFFLKNCGFFDEFVPLNQRFIRKARSTPPVIDISTLPQP